MNINVDINIIISININIVISIVVSISISFELKIICRLRNYELPLLLLQTTKLVATNKLHYCMYAYTQNARTGFSMTTQMKSELNVDKSNLIENAQSVCAEFSL